MGDTAACTFTPYEMEYFAEDELVTVVPNFSLPATTNSTFFCFAVRLWVLSSRSP